MTRDHTEPEMVERCPNHANCLSARFEFIPAREVVEALQIYNDTDHANPDELRHAQEQVWKIVGALAKMRLLDELAASAGLTIIDEATDVTPEMWERNRTHDQH